MQTQAQMMQLQMQMQMGVQPPVEGEQGQAPPPDEGQVAEGGM